MQAVGVPADIHGVHPHMTEVCEIPRCKTADGRISTDGGQDMASRP